MKKKTKSIVAVAMASAMAMSAMGITASADSTYFSPYSTNTRSTFTPYGTSNSSTSKSAMPKQLYMTQYHSGYAERLAKGTACIDAASGLLNNIDSATLGLPAVNFSAMTLNFSSTKYDYLIKANAENGTTVLTFNSESALKAGMQKIKAEEQTIMNAALAPYQSYINSIINSGSYTRIVNGDSDAIKAAKLSNAAILSAIKSTLSYTYTDADLFSGDVTGSAKTYQVAYLSEAIIGESTTQTVVANDEEFTNFPKLLINGSLTDWGSIHHLDIFNNSNNSWWYALKDGHTLNNDYYWLSGMMIPDFNSTISYDAYAGSEWTQYTSSANSNSGNNSNNNTNTNSLSRDFYYNNNYNYVSENVFGITNGVNTFYYPNLAYANAAIAASSDYYISVAGKSAHSAAAPYFCFADGNYYASIGQSRYPAYTAYMKGTGADENSATNSANSYYLHNGYVYDRNGKEIGPAAQCGYSSTSTWFSTNTGRFYTAAQSGMSGYHVNTSNTNQVDMNDPYYQYWTLKLNELKKELANNNTNNNNNNNNASNNNTSNSGTNNSNTKTEPVTSITASDGAAFISAEQLAALRASGDAIRITTKNNAKWLLMGENVIVPKDTNLRVTYNTKNVPDALKSAVSANTVANSQITIGENLKWGIKASLTVKFESKRINFIAKLYRYDTASSSLILVDSATIGNEGYVTFDGIDHGGDFFITLG